MSAGFIVSMWSLLRLAREKSKLHQHTTTFTTEDNNKQLNNKTTGRHNKLDRVITMTWLHVYHSLSLSWVLHSIGRALQYQHLKPGSQYNAGPSVALHFKHCIFLSQWCVCQQMCRVTTTSKIQCLIGPTQHKQCWNRTQVYLSIEWCYDATQCNAGSSVVLWTKRLRLLIQAKQSPYYPYLDRYSHVNNTDEMMCALKLVWSLSPWHATLLDQLSKCA